MTDPTPSDRAREIVSREVLEWDGIEQAAGGTIKTAWPIQRDRLIARLALALDAYAAERERATWEAATQIADTMARRYAEADESPTGEPTAETCAAVACAVNIAAEIRARADATPTPALAWRRLREERG